MQIQFKPALRRIWRDTGTVQIGLSAGRGTVLGGLTGDDARLLESLRSGVDPARLPVATAGRARGEQLIGLLAEARTLVLRPTCGVTRARIGDADGRLAPDAAVWSVVHPTDGDGWEVVAARRTRHVAVRGAGRLGTALATTLAAAGVGRVTVEDDRPVTRGDVIPAGARARDVGRTRGEAAEEAVRRAGGVPEPPEGGSAGRPDVVVLVDHGVADAARADGLLRSDVPHVSVVVRDDDVVIGPLVRPGSGPCLRCLDLHRTDRDPAWPSVLAQVLGPAPGTPEPEETAVATMAAGLAALQVLAQLDGSPSPAALGATLEIELPDGLAGRRVWPAHAACGCHWPPRRGRADARLAEGSHRL